MKFFSMFSGIGGFDLALEREGHECIGFSEIDKHAIAVYKKHFPEAVNYGDATQIDASKLPDFELLVGGFPCQSFSFAGKRKGFDDQRGTLFFEIARLAEAKRPAHLLLENVKGLLSAQQGYCFASILSRLDELGYCVEWQVLNSKWWLPQNRERVFIHGFREGSGRTVFPLSESNRVFDEADGGEQGEGKGVCSALRAGYDRNQAGGETYLIEAMACLTPNRLEKQQNGRRFKNQGEHRFALTGQDQHGVLLLNSATKSGYSVAEEGDGVRLQFPNSNTARGGVVKGAAQALQTSGASGVFPRGKLRRLTPTECCALQGFPRNWTATGVYNGVEKPVCDSQRYKMLGNAVSVPVVHAIGRELCQIH
jgi:DNA (cytosine-5)-methyltransferase 1